MNKRMDKLSVTAFKITTKIQFEYGVIGINEFLDRIETLEELLNDSEDFNDSNYNQERDGSPNSEVESDSTKTSKDDPEDEIIHFIPLGLKEKWIFTIGDKDPFPSVPHGHKNNENIKWPKLNPYTGRIFSSKLQINGRLDKKQMKILWNNQAFRDHCYKQVDWYCSFSPRHQFPISKSKIFRFPRW
jgi:hypothetical protein